jgi:hypothetical protein
MADFYQDSAQRRLQQIEADRAAAMADLHAHRLNSDYDSAGQVIQQVANLDAERQNLVALHERYVAQNTPPQKPYETQEQKAAKPWSQMNWDDVVEMTRTSKYAKNIRPDDPGMIAGWQEARARRGRGE